MCHSVSIEYVLQQWGNKEPLWRAMLTTSRITEEVIASSEQHGLLAL